MMKNRLLTAFFLLLLAGFGRAQTSMSVIPGSASGYLNDTIVEGSTVTFNIAFLYSGNTQYTGAIGYEILVDTSGQGNFFSVGIDSFAVSNPGLNDGDSIIVQITQNVNVPPYKLGGNTTVIWPLAIVDDTDSIQGDVYVTEVSSIEDRERINTDLYRPFPNPANDLIQLGKPNMVMPDEIMVYDMEGRLVIKAFNTRQVNVANLRKGIYLIEVTNRKGIREQHLFLRTD